MQSLHSLIWPPVISPDDDRWKRLPFEVQARWAKLVNARVEADLDESRGIDVSEDMVNLNKLWWKEVRCHREVLDEGSDHGEAAGVDHSEGLQEDGSSKDLQERHLRRTREGSPASEDSQESVAQKTCNARHVIRLHQQGRHAPEEGTRRRGKKRTRRWECSS